jgi:adenine-specific DNA-methyltransferase
MPFLDWINKSQAVGTALDTSYHLLQFQSLYGEPKSDNLLIQGDNLKALKALLPFYRGRIKCIYIDPPYNTLSAFTHYDDKLEHSQWLSMMYPRLVLLRDLLAEDGSIWVSIDDREGHYLKVMMDEIFGRSAFVANVIWQKRTSRENRAAIGTAHDHIILYAKCGAVKWKEYRNLLPATGKGYSNPDNDPRGPWRSIPFSAQGFRPNQMYSIETPTGKLLSPPKGRCWGATEPEYQKYVAEDRVYFPNGGDGRPRIKSFPEDEKGLVPMTLWLASEVGDTEASKKEILALYPDQEPFATPKPEALIQRIIQIATKPNDIVLDSFLGSGTTAAVAHKMGRRWIGIEMGEHAVSHCIPRLEKVIAGEQGGISKAIEWQGGGGFRFHTLGEPVFDADGGIHPNVRFGPLSAYLWHFETGDAARQEFTTPFLGVHNNTAYYLLYNGILGDRRPQGGNVLTSTVLKYLDEAFPHDGPRVIYGETTRLGEARLREGNIVFKQIPYDIKAR